MSLPVCTRLNVCVIVRCYLVLAGSVSPVGFPFLAHDEHFGRICLALRQALLPWWKGEARPDGTSFTCVVYDRFNRQIVEDSDGTFTELAETNPVYSAAPSVESSKVCLMLYCHTCDNGEGFHYE